MKAHGCAIVKELVDTLREKVCKLCSDPCGIDFRDGRICEVARLLDAAKSIIKSAKGRR